MRTVLMPRWGGDGGSDFYPWLQRQLARPVEVAELDRPDAPTIAGCVASLERAIGPDRAQLVLVGHSVGCQAILHTLARFAPDVRVAGTLFVAGWWSVDEPWDTIQPWLDAGPDIERARSAAGRVIALLGGGDPFTADQERNGADWKKRMGAEVRFVPGAAHFNGPEQPAVLAALRDLAGDGEPGAR